ncbi:MAG: ORF6N domain-containing protein [Xanthomonadales bacterium]|nr:ORF6N domain-containing protein [Xanthomonadales bacterium]
MCKQCTTAFYGVPTKRFNEAVKRSLAKFPEDFMFTLTVDEWTALRSQSATIKTGRGQHRKYLPNVFTEHGALMAAMLLSSPRAIEISVYVVRAFVQLRELVSSHRDLTKRLDTLEQKTQALAFQHDSLQPQHPQPTQASLRRSARTDDPTRSAQAADRVRGA